nr:hypothetical protein [Tanacetum cinerariifolium]
MAPKRTTRSTPPTTTTTTTTPVTNDQFKALINQGISNALAARDADKSQNGKDGHDSGIGVRRQAPSARECTNQDFMKCKPRVRIEAIRIFLAFAAYLGFIFYQMNVKSAFLYGTIDEEVYVSQPPGFVDPKFPNKVYKVVKALYGLHQAPRAWYATLSTFLEKSRYRRGGTDKTLFIKQDKKDIMLVKVYVDDIIFGSTKKSWCDKFGELMKNSVKTASTPIETQKPLVKDEEAANVDVYLYRSMIRSLMYLTASRPGIMFTVFACSRKSTIRGCQFLGRRLILWQCKKQTIVATSTIKAEYVATAHCCGQVLWIQKDAYEKKLIQVLKIHTDDNVADLLTKAFDVSSKELASPKQMALCKDILNMLMAGRLPKTTLPTRVNIKESFIHRTLKLDDAEGTSCLANAEIFDGLAKMGYEKLSEKLTFYKAFFLPQWKFLIHTILQCLSAKTTSWNEFSSTMASSIILPIRNEPSTSKPYKKHKSKKQKPQAPKVPSPKPLPEYKLPSPSNDPLSIGKDSMKLKELMDLCTHLSNKVLELKSKVIDIKSTYIERIEKLEGRIDKLEEENMNLKDLHNVHSKVDTVAPVMEKEKSFKQERIITDIDEDVEINLEEAQAKPYRMDLEHQEKVLITTTGATTTAEATKVSVPRRRRGVVIQEPEETTSTVVMHSDVQPKDKGKVILIEEPKPLISKAQIESERLNDAVIKYQALKRKPLTEAQARKNLIIYLKNMVGFKMNYFKGMNYNEIRPLFEKHYNYNQAFLEEVNEEVIVPENKVEVEAHKRGGKSIEKADVEASIWRDQKGRYGLAKCMQTRSSSKFVGETSTNLNPKGRNRRRSKQRVELFSLEECPAVMMADQRTMAELLRAPTEGYAEAIVVPPILAEHFELKHSLINLVTSKQIFGFEKEDPHAHIRYFNKITSTLKYKDAWDQFKDLLRACPHHGFTKLHQLDTFYNGLNPSDQYSLNSAAGGNFLERSAQDVLKIIENKSKVRNSRNKPIVSQAKEKNVDSSEIASAVARTGAMTCPATDGNTFLGYQDNIQGYVSAAAVNYNQGNIVVILKKLPEKLGDPGKFLIPCGFCGLKCKALADLGASINFMPLLVWKKLGLPKLISTRMTVELANRLVCTSAGIASDVFVLVGREELILHDGEERLVLNMKHDTLSYYNNPQRESIHMIDIYNISYENYLEDLFANKKITNHLSGNPTFSSKPNTLTSNLNLPEVKDDIFDPKGDNEHYALWEVIEFGDSYKAPQEEAASESSVKKKGRTVIITTEDMQKRRNDVKARTTLFLALFDDHQLRFSKYETAKELWEAILKTFGGNEATKKNQLKQQYGNFKAEANTSSGKGEINTASIPTASTQIKYEDITQIDEDDIEEMDIKWNMALLSMRADRFWKKTGKKITIQGTDVAGFDKSKVECFNCHKMGYFARECRAPRSQDRGRRESYKQGSNEEEPTPKALMAIDGIGWDWSYMANEEENHALVVDDEAPTQFALMEKSSSSSENKVFDDSFCSKSCRKNTDNLNTKISKLNEELSDSENTLYHYKLGLSHVEARLVEFKTQEIKLCEKIRGFEFDVEVKNNKIEHLMNELEQVKKEKDGLDSKLTGFESALKDLDTLLESQKTDKNKEGLRCCPPPPPAQVYSPPKKDMFWTGLPEFAVDTITNYSRPSPSIESNTSDLQNSNYSIFEHGESSDSIMSNPMIKFVKAADSPTVIKSNKVKTARKSPVKYAEMRNLKLNDEEGISTLPDAELFKNLALMGYNILPNQNFTFQKEIPTLRQYSRRATRIAQSKALPTAADELASFLRDDNQGEAFPTISGLEAGHDRENSIKTSALPHESTPRVTSLNADEGNAPIKERSIKTGEEFGVERSTKRGSNDTEEMVNVLTSMKAANILTSGVAAVSVPPVAGVSTVGVTTVSGLVPTVSAIFTTASVVTPYSRRPRWIPARDKGKEKVVKFDTPKKKKLKEQIDAKVAKEMEEEITRGNQRMNEQIARDAEIARIHTEEELKMMIDGLDRNNEVIARHLQEYEQSEAELTIGEKIDLINELGMTLEEIRDKFIPVWKQIEDFVPMTSKEEGESVKRKWLKLEQRSAKKMKTSEEVSEEDLKEIMQLVPVEEVYVEDLLGGDTAVYQFFVDMLKQLDKEDIQQLWALVKETLSIRHASSDKEKALWVELKRLFEPDFEDQLWTHTQNLMHDPLDWKLYDTCDVHHIFLPHFLECDSVLYEDIFAVDTLTSTNNDDKVFSLGIFIHESLYEVTNRVAPDKNIKKISSSNASLILEDYNPPLSDHELPFHIEIPRSGTLLSFSSENEEKNFNPGILISKGVHSLLPELSHRDSKVFKVINIFESPMEIFPCSYGEDIRDCPDFEASRARGFVLRSLKLQSSTSLWESNIQILSTSVYL